jgi:hypothetical protein
MQPTVAQRLTSRSQRTAPCLAGSTQPLRHQRQRQKLRKALIVRAEVDVSQQAGALEKTGPDFKPVKDVQAIMDVLPHSCVSLSSLMLGRRDVSLQFMAVMTMHVTHVSSRSAGSRSCW